MAARIEFDPTIGAVVSRSKDTVTRQTMRENIRLITSELAANDCNRLLVDMADAAVQVSIADMTFILDQLLNATHGDLRMAIVVSEGAKAHSEYASDYLSAEAVEVEIFSAAEQARAWIAA